MEYTKLILSEFPTHIAKTDNTTKVNKFWKINSQGIYNGAIHRFTRAIVIKNMHTYIFDQLSKQDLQRITDPVILKLDIYIPINYATVRLTKKGISWKPPAEDYQATNDEDNVSWIWNKCIKDCLTLLDVWPDDNLMHCRGTSSQVHFIDDLNNRKIEISFIKVNDNG